MDDRRQDVRQFGDAGAAGDVATVNPGQTALIFSTPAAGGGLPDLSLGVEVASGRQVQATGALENSFFKSIDLSGLPNAATKNVAHGITRPFTVVSIFGAANDPTGGAELTIPLPFVNNSLLTAAVQLFIQTTNIVVNTGTVNRTNFTDAYVILEYVKS